MHILQAAVALALLIGLPVFLATPTSPEEMIAATIGALVLMVVAIHGAVRFVRSRRPRPYLDSILPPGHVDVESTVIRPPKRKD